MNINSILYQSNPISIAYGLLVKVKNHILKGGNVPMTEKEEQELKEMVKQMKKQQEVLRKEQGEEQYKHLTKQDRVTVYTNDKQAMKFWEEWDG